MGAQGRVGRVGEKGRWERGKSGEGGSECEDGRATVEDERHLALHRDTTTKAERPSHRERETVT